MFYVVNLETRSILTYREGDRLVYGSEELARDKAVYAQTFSSQPHGVVPVTASGNDSLHREVAPWLVNR